ncbi:MAG: DUF2326 domain-containing protein [bacterium]
MLKEIFCDKFKINDVTRDKIVFKDGLNVVVGNDNAENSIGKSTFLMILDYVFGGSDYIKKSKDVITNVGEHTICFMFEFNNIKYYYKRDTSSSNIIDKCDEKYNKLDSLSKDDYRKELKRLYNINDPHYSFRALISMFFRVYGRENLNERDPLQDVAAVPQKRNLEKILKIYDMYNDIEELSKKYEEDKDNLDVFVSASKKEYIPLIKEKEYNENIKLLELKKEEKEKLAYKSNKDLLELDSLKAEAVSEIDSSLKRFRRDRHKHFEELNALKDNMNSSKESIKNDLEYLLEFFPDINLDKIAEIEKFHKEVSGLLKKQHEKRIKTLGNYINVLTSEIEKLENKRSEITTIPNLSKMILEKYSSIDKEIQKIETINNYFTSWGDLKTIENESKVDKEDKVIEKINLLVDSLNAKMKEINTLIYDDNTTSPIIEVPAVNRYEFYTPNDSGTGTNYKGMIVFDLACLELTPLPVLVHDSVLFKQLSDKVLDKVINLYTNYNNQIFITLDKIGQYSDETIKSINEATILKLDDNGHELFGKSWKTNLK